MSDDCDDNARAIEIVAMLGDSVVDVKHCIDPRAGKVTRRTKALLVAGAVCMVAAAGAFASSVHTAARNHAAFDVWVHVDHRPVYAFRPVRPSLGYDGVAFGGFALCIFASARGLARVRDEKRSPYYRIGTAPGVELPVVGTPSPAFPLVAPRGDDFVLHIAPGIHGELLIDGASISFAELAASGRARPSTTTPGALELAIPARGKIRARAGQVTFFVSAVARPRSQPSGLLAGIESRTLAYFAGSLAVHVGLVALLALIPEEPHVPPPPRFVGWVKLTGTRPYEPARIGPKDDDGPLDSDAPRFALAGRRAGSAPSTNHTAGFQLAIQQVSVGREIARAEAIAMARTYGVLGNSSLLQSESQIDVSAVTGGFDDSVTHGATFGAAGESSGGFGWSRDGGCWDCLGTIGSGRYGMITADTLCSELEGGRGCRGRIGQGTGRGHHVRTIADPSLRYGEAAITGDLDKAIIRRYLKRQASKLSYCYEKELLARPTLAGDLTVQFFITPIGSVTGVDVVGFDPTVATCVADVIGHIEFPRRRGGGGVQVNYPLTFRSTEQ
jgi:hypothetical protein